jgi:hypothetical protein
MLVKGQLSPHTLERTLHDCTRAVALRRRLVTSKCAARAARAIPARRAHVLAAAAAA